MNYLIHIILLYKNTFRSDDSCGCRLFTKRKELAAYAGAMAQLIRTLAGLIIAIGALLGSDMAASRAGEMAVLERALPLAKAGDSAAMEALIGLANGDYIRSAEGGEWLNEIYLDLLLEHPRAFLSAIGRAEHRIRENAIAELLRPVHDAYSGGDLLAAVRWARNRGVEAPFMTRLEDLYGELEAAHRQNLIKSRKELDRAFELCEHWGGEEPYDAAREADIVAGFDRDCAAALELARESYWTSPQDPVIAAIVVDLLGFLGATDDPDAPWSDAGNDQEICHSAAFFHRALAKYYPRFRGYFDEACPAQAAALPKK